MTQTQILVIGGGNMGMAMARGAIAAGICNPDQLVIIEPDPQRRVVATGLGAWACDEPAEGLARAGPDATVLLAVKPQVFPQAALALAPLGDRRVVSVMAGLRTEAVAKALGGGCRVVRLMPNLGVTLGAGMTGLAGGAGVNQSDVEWAVRLAKAMGEVVQIREDQFDAFTALAGSGPAYLFYLAEAMARSASKHGFGAGVADRIVRQTLLGAARLLAEGGERTAQEWRAAVTSRGGTTQAACEVLDARGVGEAVVAAVAAGAARGAALSRGEG